MRRLVVILFLCLASLANAQTSYIGQACVILVTNAANTDSSWTNLGTAGGAFVQSNPGTTPTNKVTYYDCFNGRSVTCSLAGVNAETNAIILSCWVQQPSGSGGANGVQCFQNWAGDSGPAMFSSIIGNVWYVGVRKSGSIGYYSTALSDTASFHNLFYSYNRAAGNELIAYLDGVRLTSFAGSPTSLDASSYPYTIGAYSSGTNLYASQDKAFVSHAMIFTNYSGSVDLLASNIFAYGRNNYDPGSTPVNLDDNYRAAAIWWDMIAR